MGKLKVGVDVSGTIESSRNLLQGLSLKTVWDFECFDRNGNLKWQELNRPNMITTEGLNHLLDIMFNDHAVILQTNWHIAPVEIDTTPALTMTYEVPVFTEWDGYTEAARQHFVPAAAAAGVITNTASRAVFTASEDKTLYGAALFGGANSGTSLDVTAGNVLFCYSKFATGRVIENGDTFKVTLSVTIANAA